MLETAKIFEQIVRSRRSMRVYDNNAEYNPEIVKKSLELALLSPNSSNMQLWEFYRIRSEAAKKEMAHNSLDQSAVETASEIVVIVARPDKYKKSIQFNLDTIDHPDNFESERSKIRRRAYYKKLMPLFYAPDHFFILSLLKKAFVFFVGMKRPIVREVTRINKKVTIHKSVALAAQTFMLALKSQGYDSCPIEGFDSKRIKKQLNLPRRAEINMVISVGKGTEKGIFYVQRRYDYNQVVFEK
ncbi:MAG: nitroreductase family protein [Salinivirgaceae bacterium]|jgi:nitroreductase